MFSFLKAMPEAHATISGNSNYPDLKGTVSFYEVYGGTVVAAEIQNLPKENHFHGNRLPQRKGLCGYAMGFCSHRIST